MNKRFACDKKKRYECTQCSQSFTLQRNFKAHIKHHAKERLMYRFGCVKCDEDFKEKRYLLAHYKIVHDDKERDNFREVDIENL